jgi:hypothetical protein
MDPKVDNETRESEALSRELVEKGSELSGAMAGAAIGLLGGPPGALAGAAAGVVLTHTFRWVGGELRRRMLSPREEVRIGGDMPSRWLALRSESPLERGFARISWRMTRAVGPTRRSS